jgi:hypothetical protein
VLNEPHSLWSVNGTVAHAIINALSIAPPLCRPIRFIGSIHLLCIAYLPGGCSSPHPADHSTGSVHPLCTAYLAGGVGVMHVDTQHCELDFSLFYVIFYIRKKQTNKKTTNKFYYIIAIDLGQ